MLNKGEKNMKKEESLYEHHKCTGENNLFFAKKYKGNKDLSLQHYQLALNEFEMAFLIIRPIDYEKALMMNEKIEEILEIIKEIEFVSPESDELTR